MDTRFSAEDLTFRDEVRQFFADSFTPELQGRLANLETYKAAQIEWQRTLAAKGWIAPGWPEEFGGTGWNPTQGFIYSTERAFSGAPDVIPFGLKMVAPVIYTYGTKAQQEKFLPRILNSDDWWCQGYSEPGAGSDLASLKTKAEQDGDDYVVNGAKIWTSYAQYADWIFCLVRTSTEGKKQQGISFLLIDMHSPGVKVNPIITIDGSHALNEVEFNDVRVPVENRIGEENMGWTYAKALLQHERTGIAEVANSKRALAELKELAKSELHGGAPLIEDASFRRRLSDVEIELMALEFTQLRVLASLAAGTAPGPESSLLKITGTEIQQALQVLKMDAAGYYCGVLPDADGVDSSGHDFGSAARSRYMYGRATTIYGGSNEIQKNIIAKAMLGL
jgi:alkylation response protein AidB-like acyl-CoA dehydrogenase